MRRAGHFDPGFVLGVGCGEDASLINWARKRANRLAIHHRVSPSPGPGHLVLPFPWKRIRDIAGVSSMAASRPARALNPATIRAAGDEGRTTRFVEAFIPETRVSPSIIAEAGSDSGRAAWPRGCRLPSGRPFPGGEPVVGQGDADKRGPRSKDHCDRPGFRGRGASSEPR